ncbi:C1 family peptidase [bacterium]|nr:C1 family peptidase [bacterium]
MMKRTISKMTAGSLLSLFLLAGCATVPGFSVQNGSDEVDALAKAKKYQLGADISNDPGVEMDEAFTTQAALPSKVDLRSGFSPVGNQGQFGSCTSFATIKGLQEFLLKKQGRYEAQAPAYLWYQARRQTGGKGQDTGVPTEFAMKMLDAYGSIPEKDFPYLEAAKQKNDAARKEFLERQPGSALETKGKKNRIMTGYKSVTKLSAIRNGLADGVPVVLAMRVYSSIGKTGKNGMLPMPTSKDEFQGGHAVIAAGYDNEKKVLIVRNSWGSDWADGGYFYMPYEYIKQGHVRLALVPKI